MRCTGVIFDFTENFKKKATSLKFVFLSVLTQLSNYFYFNVRIDLEPM